MKLLLLLLVGLVAAQEMTKEDIRATCRIIPRYASGPGSLSDALERWAFYMAPEGKFDVPGGKRVNSPAAWKEGLMEGWEPFKTFNHVFYTEEPVVSGNTCQFEVYHAFLAWDGACGPLIRKGVMTLEISKEGSDQAKIVGFHDHIDSEQVIAEIKSCAPEQ
eukprot:NODE_7668_length_581_cov_96.568282_g7645_i0.p2 GENE.NODE_7668_length_581_cov_96.568282_g7645_i0~~NODE_7668_length_581_cov_96.568282_g7645_i0.p2  ORF type:complete len:184 (-),score=36.56 NODE_7668_length_581_cov_96.568282_g7645_i0:30-515(-)